MADNDVMYVENGDLHSDQHDYQNIEECQLNDSVSKSLQNIINDDLVKFSELDKRAIDALKELDEESALAVLTQFRESNLEHVSNKSAFLCGVMKIHRQRQKVSKDGKLNNNNIQKSGPDEQKIEELLQRTQYTLDVTTGQRRYGGPPPPRVYNGDEPGVGCQVFIGRIPRDTYEDELVPLLESAGIIWDFRLMMDPLTGQNRGYGFATFVTKEAANDCVTKLDNYEIRPKKNLGVCVSQSNCRLFVGSIPKNKGKDEIFEEFNSLTQHLRDVIVYHQTEDKSKNRGFCFLEYIDHKAASQARRKLGAGKVKAWNNPVSVDWADPVEEPSEEVMSKVKVLYIKNLSLQASEEIVQTTFSAYGKVDRVKKIKDYAFVHFTERDHAVKAMEELNGLNLEGEPIEISLAKPVDKKKKERQLERKMQHQMGAMYARGMRGRGGRGGMAPMPMVPPMMYNGGGFVDDYYDYNLGYNNFGYGGGYEDPYYGQMQPMRGNHPGYRGGHRGMRGGIRGMTGGYFRGSRGRGKNKGRTSSFGNRGGAGKPEVMVAS